MALDLNDAEQFKRVVVDPLITALQGEITPLVARVEKLEAVGSTLEPRVQTLEGYARRLGTVYTGIIAVVTFISHWAWSRVKAKFFT